MKKLINKVKTYYKTAYKSNIFPSFSDLFFSKKKIFAYYGFLGDKNFGDEWVFESAKHLFPEYTLLAVQTRMPLRGLLIKKLLAYKISGIVIGGGTLIGPKFWYSKDFIKLKKTGIPIMVHGTGVHNLPGFNQNWNVMLGGSFFGGVRGYKSVENLKAQSPIVSKVIGDAAFAMFENKKTENDSKRVLINLGTHVPYEGFEKVRKAINLFMHYLTKNGYELVFFPFHGEDLNIANGMKEEFPRMVILPIPAVYNEAVKVFNESAFAVGERLHFTVMALMSACPMYAVNYEKKHLDMLDSLKADNFGYLPNNVTFEGIKNIFETRKQQDFTTVFSHVKEYQALQFSEAKRFEEACK